MPIPIPQALDDAGAAARTKAEAARSWPRYLLSSALAGAYVGVAIVLLVSLSAPLAAAGSPATRLVQAAVFGLALTLVVFAGSELFTGNAMVMIQGLREGTVTIGQLAAVWGLSLGGNLLGSFALAGAVHGAGTLTGPGADLIASVTAAKDATPGAQLFWRAVLCNALVCLALWMASRATSDGAKLAVLWWGLLAFIGSGFEHSVANMTTFGLGILQGSSTGAELARNLAFTVPGNVVGGGLVIGLGYAWLGRPASTGTADPATTDPGPSQPARPATTEVPSGPAPVPALARTATPRP